MDRRLDTTFFQTHYLSIRYLSMMRPSLRTKQERRPLIEVEGAAEEVQEAGEEGEEDLGDGEGGVGEGVRKYGVD